MHTFKLEPNPEPELQFQSQSHQHDHLLLTGDNMINAYFNEFRVNKAAAHAKIAAQISIAFGGFFCRFGSAN